jgi:hypothetical protein
MDEQQHKLPARLEPAVAEAVTALPGAALAGLKVAAPGKAAAHKAATAAAMQMQLAVKLNLPVACHDHNIAVTV